MVTQAESEDNMTIDEAIEKFKFIAKSDTPCSRYCMLPCDQCVDKSEHIAEWLEELKMYRESSYGELYDMVYNKAIDDFRAEICNAIVQSERNGNYRFYAVETKQYIADLAEKLKH